MNQSLYEYCLRLGDTPLILSQRIGEYCSKAPHLEEDLAITNVGLDLLGQAENFLTYAASLKEELTADELSQRRNMKLYSPDGRLASSVGKNIKSIKIKKDPQ